MLINYKREAKIKLQLDIKLQNQIKISTNVIKLQNQIEVLPNVIMMILAYLKKVVIKF